MRQNKIIFHIDQNIFLKFKICFEIWINNKFCGGMEGFFFFLVNLYSIFKGPLLKNLFSLLYSVTQPIFLGGLIRYFSQSSGIGHDTAYLYAAGIAVCSTFNVFAMNPVWLAAYHAGMKMRVGICSLIYRKVNLV
jgi:hypothetical protein